MIDTNGDIVANKKRIILYIKVAPTVDTLLYK